MGLSTSRLVAFGAAILLLWGGPASADHSRACVSCIVMDDTGRVLFAHHADERRANASTTKIVTALVVRDEVSLEEEVVVSPVAASVGGGGLDLDPGDSYRVGPLLHALLLTSSNEAAVALAEHVAGAHEAFVSLMNESAARLRATDTHFVTAHGLDMTGHYSSAADLARLGLELLEDSFLAQVVGTRRTTIPGPEGNEVIENRNVLLETYPGASGIKTGYTALAGDVLVASATQDDRAIVAVTMGASGAAAAASEAAVLLDRGWDLLAQTVLVRRGTAVGSLVFDPAGATEVIVSAPVRGSARRAEIELEFRADPGITPPIHAGQEVGELLVSAGGRVLFRVPAHARDAVDPIEEPWGGEAISAVLRAVAGLVDEVVG